MSFFELQEVADGVYAAIVVDGSGALGNAGFVNLGGETLVFDTFLNPQAAQALRAEAERLTGNTVTYVVNSHFHGDHTYGNQVFADATIISTERTRELFLEANRQLPDPSEFAAYLKAEEERAAVEPDERKRRAILTDISDKTVMAEALKTLKLTAPTLTFDQRLEIHGTKRRVELMTYGGGHTKSDAFLYLPEERILFAADLVLVNNHPWMGHGNPEQWPTILDRLSELEIEHIVPGHGPVGTKEAIDLIKQYVTDMVAYVNDCHAKGMEVSQAMQGEIPAAYAEWEGATVYEWNVNALLMAAYEATKK